MLIELINTYFVTVVELGPCERLRCLKKDRQVRIFSRAMPSLWCEDALFGALAAIL